MKLCISTIAWRPDEDEQVARLLNNSNIKAIEVAPGKIGPSPADLSDEEIHLYRMFWEDRGISLVAMQALLFGTEGLSIFESAQQRADMASYLTKIIKLASKLGVNSLVFGSPKNRVKGPLSQEEAEAIAIPFFKDLGQVAYDHGTTFLLEANPAVFGCDFINKTSEAIALAQKVDHPGFSFHVDSSTLAMENEPLAVLPADGNLIRHFHASEPNLGCIADGSQVNHKAIAGHLSSIAYQGYVSIEMRDTRSPQSNYAAIAASIERYKMIYSNI
jgi:D-psicose/D-tagatose/L-ribulose 3-epimerase